MSAISSQLSFRSSPSWNFNTRVVVNVMDSIYAIAFGLGLRTLVDAVSQDFKLTGSLIGLWEGVVTLHFLKKMPKSSDPYIAYGVRLFVDFLVTESIERLVLVLIWTAFGMVLADVAPGIWDEVGLKRVWRHFRRDIYTIYHKIPTVAFFPPPRTVRFLPPREHSISPSITNSQDLPTEDTPIAVVPPSPSAPSEPLKRRVPGYYPGDYSDTDVDLGPIVRSRSRSRFSPTTEVNDALVSDLDEGNQSSVVSSPSFNEEDIPDMEEEPPLIDIGEEPVAEPATPKQKPYIPMPPTPSDSAARWERYRERDIMEDAKPRPDILPNIPDSMEDGGTSDDWEKIQRGELDEDKPPTPPAKDRPSGPLSVLIPNSPPIIPLDINFSTTDSFIPQIRRQSAPPPYADLGDCEDIYGDWPPTHDKKQTTTDDPNGNVNEHVNNDNNDSNSGINHLASWTFDAAAQAQAEKEEAMKKQAEEEAKLEALQIENERKIREQEAAERERKRKEEEEEKEERERKQKEEEERERKQKEEEDRVRKQKEEEERVRKQKEEEERLLKQKEEEERLLKQKEEEERVRKQKEEEERVRKQKEEERVRKQKEDEERVRKQKEDEERVRKDAEQEAEKKRKDTEERKKKEADDAALRKQKQMEREQEARQAEEEAEKKRREQEAAEQKRKEEEAEQKRQEAEVEQKRLDDEAEQKRREEEQEEEEKQKKEAAAEKQKQEEAAKQEADKARKELEEADKTKQAEAQEKSESETQQAELDEPNADMLGDQTTHEIDDDTKTLHGGDQNLDTVHDQHEQGPSETNNPTTLPPHADPTEEESVTSSATTADPPDQASERLKRMMILRAQTVELEKRLDEVRKEGSDELVQAIEKSLRKYRRQAERRYTAGTMLSTYLKENETDSISLEGLHPKYAGIKLEEKLEELLAPTSRSILLTLTICKKLNDAKKQKPIVSAFLNTYNLTQYTTENAKNQKERTIEIPEENFAEWLTGYRSLVAQRERQEHDNYDPWGRAT